MEENLTSAGRKKAELLAGGRVKVGGDIKLPVKPSRSTAGPGAGSVGVVLEFEGHRVKKTISKESGEFELRERGDEYELLRDGEPFLEHVHIQPTLAHAPEQAFYNIETECIYDCKFCTSRRLEKQITKSLTPEKIVKMILDLSRRSGL